METNYQEVSLNTIVKYFADDFKTKPGTEIITKEWFIDPVKGVVIFKLVTDKKDDLENDTLTI
ncbi:hypothetical protein QT397_08845 [Microbulbifer sp. MKSA007]|nr:hypothetical protein QT397_08845 [Microbulbifer sp. MKSA007]